MSLRRTYRAPLRLRVMAGVVAVALIALVAFDTAAITTMRRYLLGQTDTALKTVLNVTRPQLGALVPFYGPGPGAIKQASVPGARFQFSHPVQNPVPQNVKSVLGQYALSYLPARGTAIHLEIGAFAALPHFRPAALQSAALESAVPGEWTAVGADGKTPLRLAAERVPGGVLMAGANLGQVDETVALVTLFVILGSIAAVLLIGLGVFLVLRRGLRPIESMAAQADRISAGDLTDRVDLKRPASEVGRLGTALNGMLSRIETSVAAREADQELMRRFIADASHELRNPLASLRANVELYQEGMVTERSRVDEVMRRITLETQRMGRLVDDMLRLARLDQHPEREHEAVDMTELIEGCIERARIAEPARPWRTRIAANLIVVGDEELLRRAIDNLLANVRTHVPGGAAAAVTATGHDGMVTITVDDDGPGVPAENLPHIFDRFYRAASPGKSAGTRSGSGLGLAIVSETANAHGGTAWASLKEPNGLCVTLTLPDWSSVAHDSAASGDLISA
jgi:two-component system, OmpR family, sensor kinase